MPRLIVSFLKGPFTQSVSIVDAELQSSIAEKDVQNWGLGTYERIDGAQCSYLVAAFLFSSF
jgi:hypothetical protein